MTRFIFIAFLTFYTLNNFTLLGNNVVNQIAISKVEDMPNIPTPFKIIDFRNLTVQQDQLLFNPALTGDKLPLITIEQIGSKNFPALPLFRIPSYVGQTKSAESLSCIGSVIGASMIGINKSNQYGNNFVTMTRHYFNAANGENLVLNNFSAKTGGTFWYEVFPSVAFFQLVDMYGSKQPEMIDVMRKVADRWIEGLNNFPVKNGSPDFEYTSFSFSEMIPVSNDIWKEPDAAAGVAWMFYMAWKQFGEKKYYDASLKALKFLQDFPENPYYEILMPYGALLASRINVEEGGNYNFNKMINWCFDGDNKYRRGWGVLTHTENGIDMHGLVGSRNTNYGFAMNTFDQLSTMIPITKYQPQYARALGKWALNAINASRLYFSAENNPENQTCWQGQNSPLLPVAYEGVRATLKGGNFDQYIGKLAAKGPYAVGDYMKKVDADPNVLDLCPYGSGWLGKLAAIYEKTEIEGILRLDCNVSDFFSDKSYPTYLYYNPHQESKTITLQISSDQVIYNMLSNSEIDSNNLIIEADNAALVRIIPRNAQKKVVGRSLMIGNSIVDYNYVNDVSADHLSEPWSDLSLQAVQYSGSTTDFVLPSSVITFGDNGSIEIKPTLVSASTSFFLDKLKEIRFNRNSTSTQKTLFNSTIKYWLSHDELWIEGEDLDNKRLSIYSVSGRLMSQLNYQLNTPIYVGNLPKGVYLIRLNNQTIKFIR